MRLLGGGLLGVWMASVPIWGAPSQLNQIPTADILPMKQLQIGVQNANTNVTDDPSIIRQPQPMLQSQYGLTKRIELGLDVVPTRGPDAYRPIFNIKYDVLQESYDSPAVAVGMSQLGPNFQSSPYLVVTRTINYSDVQYNKFRAHHRNQKLRGRRIHAGIMRLNGQLVPLVGTDIEINDKFILYADYMGGPQNGPALGGSIVFNERTNLPVALLKVNATHKVNGAILNYAYNFQF
jgi:hypothetical protein